MCDKYEKYMIEQWLKDNRPSVKFDDKQVYIEHKANLKSDAWW